MSPCAQAPTPPEVSPWRVTNSSATRRRAGRLSSRSKTRLVVTLFMRRGTLSSPASSLPPHGHKVAKTMVPSSLTRRFIAV